jgi:hypothetical protein
MATEQGRRRLDRGRLPGFEQIKQLDAFFIRSGLLTPETLLQVSLSFSDIELVNACHVCDLNPIATLYHL